MEENRNARTNSANSASRAGSAHGKSYTGCNKHPNVPTSSMSAMRSMSSAVRHMRLYAERSMAKRNLGFPEQLIIMHLHAAGESNQDALAQLLEIDKGAVAKTLGKLEEKGLVERTVNPKNKREKRIALTNAATPVIKEMAASWQTWVQTVFAEMGDGELQTFLGTMETVAERAAGIARDKED